MNEYYEQVNLFTNTSTQQAFAVCILRNLAKVIKDDSDIKALAVKDNMLEVLIAEALPEDVAKVDFAKNIFNTGTEWTTALSLAPKFFSHILATGGIINDNGTKEEWDQAFLDNYAAIVTAGV